MSFNNCICVRKGGEWEDIDNKQYWTTTVMIDKETSKPILSTESDARVEKNEKENIEGDPYGRCVGVVVLNHKLTSKKILIASVHVVPFGGTKAAQQKASLSLASMARDITGEDCPVILAGDFNIFNDERGDGTFQLINDYAKSLSLQEIPLKKMVIPDMPDITDSKEIGTFNPWSTDTNAKLVYNQPLGYSKLDAIFASSSLECKDGVTVYPVLMKQQQLNDPSKMTEEDKEIHTDLRYMFKDKLASDHFLLTAEFTFKTYIKVASMDVSCDTHASKVREQHGEEYGFEQRFQVQFDEIEKQKADVVNLQEIRYPENLKFIQEMKSEKYNVYHFANNDSEMSFNNCICVRMGGEWEDIDKKQYWTTIDETGKPILSTDRNARVQKNESKNIKGDPHGRCVGVVVLKHKQTSKKLLVASAHVVPFGGTKAAQQKATLSLASMVRDITKEDCPVIIAGDFNIFNDEREDGTFQLINKYAESLSLKEIPLKKMVIPDKDMPNIITEPKEIDTFNPWSTDTNAEMVYKQPLGYSKLDAIFASTSLECNGVTVFPVLTKQQKLNNPSEMTDEDKKTHTKLRYMFKDKLASDHFLLTAKFTFKSKEQLTKNEHR